MVLMVNMIARVRSHAGTNWSSNLGGKIKLLGQCIMICTNMLTSVAVATIHNRVSGVGVEPLRIESGQNLAYDLSAQNSTCGTRVILEPLDKYFDLLLWILCS